MCNPELQIDDFIEDQCKTMMKRCDYEVNADDTRIRTADKSAAIRTENGDEIDDFSFEQNFYDSNNEVVKRENKETKVKIEKKIR